MNQVEKKGIHIKDTLKGLGGVLLGALIAVGLVVLPAAGIQRAPKIDSFSWQEIDLFIAAAVGGAIAGFLIFANEERRESFLYARGLMADLIKKPSLKPLNELVNQFAFEMVFSAFLFWYVACAGLLKRLSLGCFSQENAQIAQTIGLLVCLAGIIKGLAVLAASGKEKMNAGSNTNDMSIPVGLASREVRHPLLFAFLIFLLGVPLCLATLYPLVAIPGAIVVINWKIRQNEEKLVISLGEPFKLYQQSTKRLIPFVF